MKLFLVYLAFASAGSIAAFLLPFGRPSEVNSAIVAYIFVGWLVSILAFVVVCLLTGRFTS